MDLAELEKMVAAPETGPHAAYLAADMRRILPALADPARAAGAVAELQGWASAAGDGLRKRFASAFIDKAKAALGGQSAASAISQFSKPFQHGAPAPKRGAVADRFAGKSDHHPMPDVNGGNTSMRGRAPAPRVEHGAEPAARLSAPAAQPHDAPHPADAAHRSGARLAGLAAKHSFKLGVTAAGAVGAAAGGAAGAPAPGGGKAWHKLKNVQKRAPQAPATRPSMLAKLFDMKHLRVPNGPDPIPAAHTWTCPNCGASHGMAKMAPKAADVDNPLVVEPQDVVATGNAADRARQALKAPTKQDANGQSKLQPAKRRCQKCGHESVSDGKAKAVSQPDAQPKTAGPAAVRWQSGKNVAGGGK